MNNAFQQLAVDAVYSWLETDDPAGLLQQASADPGVRGVSVTIPHKVTCATLVGVAPASEVLALGALNTLVRTDVGWSGHNTDALAASALLRAALPAPSEAHVAVLGNGGAARAVAWSARELGCRVSLFARASERAAGLASELGIAVGGTLDQVPAHGLAAIVNATSVGMTPDSDRSPVDPSVFNKDVVAYDLVYTPANTRFLGDAHAAGSRTVSGVDHFLAQARAQLVLWLGEARVAPLNLERLLSCAP
jgi:shikimate dehydrogenase